MSAGTGRRHVSSGTRWEPIARAHRASFDAVRPPTSMVEVRALIDPEMRVEIEAEAWVGDRPETGDGDSPPVSGRLPKGARR